MDFVDRPPVEYEREVFRSSVWRRMMCRQWVLYDIRWLAVVEWGFRGGESRFEINTNLTKMEMGEDEEDT